MSVLWHNGTWECDEDPLFTIDDRIRLGDGVFDTMLAMDDRLIHPARHEQRLRDNAAVFGITFDLDFEETARALITRMNPMNGRIAINTLITRGPGRRGIAPPDDPQIQIIMRASPAPHPDTMPSIKVIIAETVRRNEGSPLSRIKSCNYGDNILALKEAKEKGANEAILLNNAGRITCATSANLFACMDAKLYTPPLGDGALNGTTRQVLMEQYPVTEKSLTPADLKNADHLFLTNSMRGAQAITRLDDKTYPASLPLGIDKDFYIL